MKSLLIFASLLISSFSFAGYYPESLNKKIQSGELKDKDLRLELFLLLSKTHKSIGYNPAKRALFGQLHLQQNGNQYFIHDAYCKKDFTSGVGPGSVPDQNKVNCEHTWPQSKFTSQFPEDIQKSDLHHLFPTDSRANSTRGNFAFADVSENKHVDPSCTTSKSGPSVTQGGDHFFEPPQDHKGNVARALFYFAVKYKMAIDDKQEEFLRRWDKLDPIDDAEVSRNSEIEKLQKSRNPFVDYPNLADSISNF